MKMQQKKADELGVRLWAEFGNFAWTDQKVLLDTAYSPIIVSDEARIIQVLLGLQSNALKFLEQDKKGEGNKTSEVKITAAMIQKVDDIENVVNNYL